MITSYPDHEQSRLLKEAIDASGQSASALARELGLKPGTIHAWANGDQRIPFRRWQAFRRRFGLPSTEPERGELIRVGRERVGLSQEAVAAICGVEWKSISRWERLESVVPDRAWEAIRRHLDPPPVHAGPRLGRSADLVAERKAHRERMRGYSQQDLDRFRHIVEGQRRPLTLIFHDRRLA